MTPITDHPAYGLLRSTAYRGARPPADEVDALVEDLTRSDLGPSALGADSVRRQVLDAVEAIVGAHADGEQGRARQIADEAARSLAGGLPDYTPSDPDALRPVADVVASIPRGVG